MCNSTSEYKRVVCVGMIWMRVVFVLVYVVHGLIDITPAGG